MKRLLHFSLRSLHLCLLRVASLLVPHKQRLEWRKEWQGELWHVQRTCTPDGSVSWEQEWGVTAFCLGAFKDALCLRSWARPKPEHGQAAVRLHGSAAQCLLGLAAVLAASYALSILLPGVRTENHLSRSQVRSGLIFIQNARFNDVEAATIPIEQFRDWKARSQKYFDGLAFYRISPESVGLGTEIAGSPAHAPWQVAHASPNLFALLGLPVRAALSGAENGDGSGVILSEEVWQNEFGGNRHVVGSMLRVGLREVRVLGVAPEGVWRLPGKADAWLMEPDGQIASKGAGYVVGHLTPAGQEEMYSQRVHITSTNSDDADDDLWGESFNERTRGPWEIYEFTLMLAFLALPAITSVSLGDYSPSLHKPSWGRRLCRWGFMAVKIALLLPIVYYVSLDMSYGNASIYSTGAEYIQLISSFSMCLFGLQWAIKDQRQRCPVCLRRVTNPAHVGLASRTFLAWNGTEMMCMGGHTLLHVPGLPTSWFSTQRWLYLDTSWGFLFAGPGEL